MVEKKCSVEELLRSFNDQGLSDYFVVYLRYFFAYCCSHRNLYDNKNRPLILALICTPPEFIGYESHKNITHHRFIQNNVIINLLFIRY